jgi:hypothetical protein
VWAAAGLLLAAGCREPRSATPPGGAAPSRPASRTARANDPTPTAEKDGRAPATPGPEHVLLQIDFEPTGPLVARRDAYQRYGRVPAITLYRDGSLLFSTAVAGEVGVRDSWEVLMRRVGARTARDLNARALELGAHRLSSHHDWCDPSPTGEAIGASDQPYMVLRVRTPDDRSATTRVETSCRPAADDPIHRTHAALSRLAVRSSEAVAYHPTKASVYFTPSLRADQADPWPLSPALFDAAVARDWSLTVLGGRELDRLVAAIRTNNGGALLGAGDRKLFVDVVPWLPGEDYTEAIARDHLRLPRP